MRKFVAIYLMLALVFLSGCGKKEERTEQPAQETRGAVPKAETTQADEYVLVLMECVVIHAGYEGTIVAPGVSKPTSGTVVALECNGKNVEIVSKTIVDGYIETKDFGKIGVRFRSMVLTVGAGDYTSVREGATLPERAIEVYVQKSKLKEFANRFPK